MVRVAPRPGAAESGAVGLRGPRLEWMASDGRAALASRVPDTSQRRGAHTSYAPLRRHPPGGVAGFALAPAPPHVAPLRHRPPQLPPPPSLPAVPDRRTATAAPRPPHRDRRYRRAGLRRGSANRRTHRLPPPLPTQPTATTGHQRQLRRQRRRMRRALGPPTAGTT
jgi:hypothetical protein